MERGGILQASSQDTKSLTSARFLLFPSTRDGTSISPTLRCVLQLRISRPQWVFFNGVKGQTGVIVQSDPSISINGSLLLGQR